MTPQMIAALSSGRFTATGLYQIDFPDGSRKMMLGAGETIWGADTFKGFDPTFGHIDTGDDVKESADGVAPNSVITVIPSDSADRTVIAAPTIQLSPLKVWLAALTLDVNQHITVVPDPELVFDGFVDQATSNLDANTDAIDYTIISGFDYFFEDREGQRLNGPFHQSAWAGEKGLDNVTGVTKKVYWGAYGPGGGGGATSGIGSGAGGAGGGRVVSA